MDDLQLMVALEKCNLRHQVFQLLMDICLAADDAQMRPLKVGDNREPLYPPVLPFNLLRLIDKLILLKLQLLSPKGYVNLLTPLIVPQVHV